MMSFRNLLNFHHSLLRFFCIELIKIKKKHYLIQKLSTSLSYLKLNLQKLIF